MADYDIEKAQGKQVKPYIYEIMVHATRLKLDVGDFQALAKVVRDPHDRFTFHLHPEAFDEDFDEEEERIAVPSWEETMEIHSLPHFEDMLPKSTRNELARRLAAFSSGVNQLLFSNGSPIDFDTFSKPAERGRVPVNIIYLNTILDEAQKQYFVQEIARKLYDWMLTQQPTEGELKMLFFMDEVAPYLPPVRNPPAKDLIKLIFKQARKYGVACALATQSPSDVDYKILGQANTKFLGRFIQPQDVDKVKKLLEGAGGDTSFVQELPTLKAGQFQLVSPDISAEPVPIQSRCLLTEHGGPLNEEQVEELTSPELRAWARTRSSSSTRTRGDAAVAAAKGAENFVEGGEGVVAQARIPTPLEGMAAAATGVVDESAFEVRLMGGLAVLKDGRDPLYVMQGLTNTVSTVALGWTLVALLLNWQNSTVDWWWLALGFSATMLVFLVVALEMFLSHDALLQQKISRFARLIQYGLTVWLWTLLIWAKNSPSLMLYGAEMLLEVTVVRVTLFLIVELVNRFRLGRAEWSFGHSGIDAVIGGIKGFTATITGMQLKEMNANSRQIMAGIRWVLDFITLLFLTTIVVVAWVGSGEPLADSLNALGGEMFILKPALWLGSIYLLIFSSETWLRARSKMPEAE